MNLERPQSTMTGSAEETFQYLDILLKSDRLRKSPSLNHLLEYLVRKAVEGKNEEVKESIIAIDVFGRSCEFDGRLDNIVRVQAHRLRKILDAYYASEGSHDKFVVSIPKGSYIATIHPREDGAIPAFSTVDASHLEVPPTEFRPGTERRPMSLWLASASAFLVEAVP